MHIKVCGDDGDGDGTNFEIVTRAFGDVGDKNGKKSEAGIKKKLLPKNFANELLKK